MLRLEEVSKSYILRGQAVTGLAQVSFEVARGDFTAVVGPSGSGKSTLLLVMGGMLSPSSGRVEIGETSIYDLSPDERAAIRRTTIGFVFQTFNLTPYLTARENVQLPLYLTGVSEARQQERASELLTRLGLAQRLDHKPGELSVGQQQRVALARVLANDPAMILADEPTGSLDPETIADVLAFLEELNEEGRVLDSLVVALRHGAAIRESLAIVATVECSSSVPPTSSSTRRKGKR